MIKCGNCGKENEFTNYCDWECHVEAATKSGGKIIAPNNLPITCIKHDGTLLEHSDADNPNYKFPITVEFVGIKPEGYDDCNSKNYDPFSYEDQSHALLFCDRYVAVTIYECRYFMWSCHKGFLHNNMNGYKAKEWKITEKSLAEIDIRFPKIHYNLETVGGLKF